MKLQDNPCLIDLTAYPDDFSPCHRRVLSARNIPPNQLKKSLADLIDVAHLRDAKSAAMRLYHAIKNQEKIVIVGDYDADGATATALVLSVLQQLGAVTESIIPNRISMGYGLSSTTVDEILQNPPDLILTVDNGITAVSAVDTLKAAGITVIISDHHLPKTDLPAADFIVNPNHPDCLFPSKALAGVGVVFYLMLALRQVYREKQDKGFESVDCLKLLPLVAIGTVADVVPLDYNNRILVEQGLKLIRQAKAAIGINALIEMSECDITHLNSEDIAFQIAPRLNAAGRIADMQLGVDCLLTENPRLAKDYAFELDRLNRERKAIENEMKAQAQAWIEALPIDNRSVICLYEPHWHEGIIGILAGRLKTRYDKPVFIFTQSEDGSRLKGSARAPQAIDLMVVLNAIANTQPSWLEQYGGHAKAAGLSIEKEHFEGFSLLLEEIVREQLENQPHNELGRYTDGELLPYEFNISNAQFLKTLEVWGQGVPLPCFRNSFYIEAIRPVGDNHAQLTLIEEQSGQQFSGIAFDKYNAYHSLSQMQKQIAYQIAYHLKVNDWRGKQMLSLQIVHIEE